MKRKTKDLLLYGFGGRKVAEYLRENRRKPLASPVQVLKNVAEEAVSKIDTVLNRIEMGPIKYVPFDEIYGERYPINFDGHPSVDYEDYDHPVDHPEATS